MSDLSHGAAGPDTAPSSPPPPESLRSGRITALLLLVFALLLAVASSQIEYAFSSDPIGPRAFPYMLSGGLAICAAWYLVKPGAADPWPHGATLAHALLLIAVTAFAVGLMDHIGFLAAAFMMCATAAWLFGAKLPLALAIGAAQAVFWFVLFKYLLGTYLPAGTWFFPA